MKYFAFGFILLSSLLIRTVCAQTVPACNSTLKDAPSIRGLRLGMSSVEALKIVEIDAVPKGINQGIRVKLVDGKYVLDTTPWTMSLAVREEKGTLNADERKTLNDLRAAGRNVDIGKSVFVYEKSEFDLTHPSQLQGISMLELSFLGKELYKIHILYDRENGPAWSSTKEFTDNISEKLGLAKDSWEEFHSGRIYRCRDFQLRSFDSFFGTVHASLFLENTLLSSKLPDLALQKYNESENKTKQDKENQKKAFKP